jgi:23S rRNA (pseudouridine1915-N3)-methyltransferase
VEIVLLSVQSGKEEWAQTATETYQEKIAHHIKFQDVVIKSKKLERDESTRKRQEESASLLNAIKESDFVILCDEDGKSFESLEFSKKLRDIFDRGSKRVVFVIGGAFGVDDTVKKRSNLTVSLSKMTMNHMVAKTFLLEQLYRAMMIWKGKPYHNE